MSQFTYQVFLKYQKLILRLVRKIIDLEIFMKLDESVGIRLVELSPVIMTKEAGPLDILVQLIMATDVVAPDADFAVLWFVKKGLELIVPTKARCQ